MKIKSKPKEQDNGDEVALIEMTNKEVKSMLESTRYYMQAHQHNTNETSFKEMSSTRADLKQILDIMHGRKPLET